MATYVFGDASGWLNPFESALNKIGGSLWDCHIPDDTKVVHVGDLVHRGPDSVLILELVESMIIKYPEQWIQLIGNHESHYLTSDKFWIDDDDVKYTIKEMYQNDLLTKAWANETHLVTHAGIHFDFWTSIGEPQTALETAEAVNALTLEQCAVPGIMRGERYTTPGPIWASSQKELYPSWEKAEQGLHNFVQVHGHTAPLNHLGQRWEGYSFDWFVRQKQNLVFSKVKDYKFVSTDPGLSKAVRDYIAYKVPTSP